MKLLTASLCVVALLAGCNAATTRPSSAMASGRDRTFSVPVYGTDTAPAYGAATRECQKLMLFPSCCATTARAWSLNA
ncbi:hypothetical protein [Acidovorax sp. LjRoot117]|uniref:hypothetical protein n=1 Tax=Acidovorax sp. LjRoot117 TaxID=3342255 RepID=UPI003ECF1545